MSTTALQRQETNGRNQRALRKEFRFRHVARVTLECRTPLHLGAGDGDARADQAILRDANGLPLIRGTSLAGLLRVPYRPRDKVEERKRIFGFQDHGTEADGSGSRLWISDACIHDQNDVPVVGLRRRGDLERDAILGVFLKNESEIRRHTAIDHRGTAREGALYSEELVGIGHRFTFEMELIDCAGTDGKTPAGQANWEELLAGLHSVEFRLGGKTRRGYGSVQVMAEKLVAQSFDLHRVAEPGFGTFHDYIARSVRLDEPCLILKKKTVTPDPAVPDIEAILELSPRGWWRMGDGTKDCPGPLVSPRVNWETRPAALDPVLVIPGSAWKGVLRHRATFHFLRLTGKLAGPGIDVAAVSRTADTVLARIFGEIRGADRGRRGALIVDDIAIEQDVSVQMRLHRVKIDRFTGGAWPQALFDERAVWKGVGEIPLRLCILIPHWPHDSEPELKAALKAALEDIAESRLPIGAGAARGQGFFEGRLKWTDRCAGEKETHT